MRVQLHSMTKVHTYIILSGCREFLICFTFFYFMNLFYSLFSTTYKFNNIYNHYSLQYKGVMIMEPAICNCLIWYFSYIYKKWLKGKVHKQSIVTPNSKHQKHYVYTFWVCYPPSKKFDCIHTANWHNRYSLNIKTLRVPFRTAPKHIILINVQFFKMIALIILLPILSN